MFSGGLSGLGGAWRSLEGLDCRRKNGAAVVSSGRALLDLGLLEIATACQKLLWTGQSSTGGWQTVQSGLEITVAS